MCYPQQLGRSWKVFDLPRNLLEPHQLSAPEPSGSHQLSAPDPPGPCLLSGTLRNLISCSRTSSAICPGPTTSSAICAGTLRNLIGHLPRNPPEPHQPSAPEPSGTSSAICTGTLWNRISHLHQNPLEPHQPSAPEPSAPEPSGTSLAICPETLWNLISHLHRNPLEFHQPSAPEPSGTLRNPPEPSPEPGVAAAPDRTRLFWAKDPIASFAVGEKND